MSQSTAAAADGGKPCNGACHRAKAPDGDTAKLYTRANAKVKSLDGLRRQVERCVAMVGAQIAPDEIEAVVAALNVNQRGIRAQTHSSGQKRFIDALDEDVAVLHRFDAARDIDLVYN
jgi:hypothetical protein